MLHISSPIRSWRASVVAGVLLAVCSVASAQWGWKEGDRKVFSDTAPPTSVPDKAIFKRPGGGSMPVQAAPAPEPAAAAAASAPQVPKVDKELEARKKQADEAEQARIKAEEQRVAAARSDSCERARKGKATMDSGVRLATTNAKGEREIMDDKARASESRRLDEVMRSDCGPLPAPTRTQ